MAEKLPHSWDISSVPEITGFQVMGEVKDALEIVALEFVAPIFPSFMKRRILQTVANIANKH